MSDQLDDVDFALAAFLADGRWRVQEIAAPAFASVDSLVSALRRLPGDESTGCVGMVAVDEDFFVLTRVVGSSVAVLLSDVTAAEEWELARSVTDYLRLPPLEDDEEDEEAPAGSLDLLDDLGLSAPELADLLDEEDLYPDEMLSDIADTLGFGDLFDDAVGLTNA